MPESFDINSSSGSYSVKIEANALNVLKQSYPTAFYIIDSKLAPHLSINSNHSLVIDATEENKSLEAIAQYVIELREKKVHRKTHLIAIGGGVIQDIATFLASIYMRGLKWTYLPTTLLGMVDSCIGGKSSINVSGYKNLVGNFYPPGEIAIDLGFTATLDEEAIVAGLCEAAKICYAYSEDVFDTYLAGISSNGELRGNVTESLVFQSLMSKKWFIEIDEFDQKERLLLNFGHTFGHALEGASNYGISHGIGVGIGMLVAIQYSKNHQLLDPKGLVAIGRLSTHIEDLLANIKSLQSVIKQLSTDDIMKKFESDKKHLADQYRVVVPTGSGRLALQLIEKSTQSQLNIVNAFNQAFERITTSD
jgi:3-dehydroquinate synthase